MLIYLDMCSLLRPFDDKSQLRVSIEAEAVLGIVALCESGQAGLISSEALRYENGRNPHPVRKAYVIRVLDRADRFVPISEDVENRAQALEQVGLKPLDALHLACAVEAEADYFCTCDDRLLKRARVIQAGPPKIVSPLELIAEFGP